MIFIGATTELYCCGCTKTVNARLTNGSEIYKRRPDLRDIPFWKCDACGGFVGCHYKTKQKYRPLGCIPTPELSTARKQIHALLDPLWKSGAMSRSEIYSMLGALIGREYHTADIRSMDEAKMVLDALREYSV